MKSLSFSSRECFVCVCESANCDRSFHCHLTYRKILSLSCTLHHIGFVNSSFGFAWVLKKFFSHNRTFIDNNFISIFLFRSHLLLGEGDFSSLFSSSSQSFFVAPIVIIAHIYKINYFKLLWTNKIGTKKIIKNTNSWKGYNLAKVTAVSAADERQSIAIG